MCAISRAFKRLQSWLLVTVFSVVVCVDPVLASRLFTSGFEENNTTTTMWTSAGAGASVVTTTPHSGTYALELAGASGKNLGRSLSASITTDPTTIRVRWYWRTNSFAFSSRIFSDRSGGGTHALQVTVLSTGVVRLTNAVSATTVDTSATLSINTQYRFEVEHKISDTIGNMIVRVYAGDDASPIEEISLPTVEDTLPLNIRDFFFEESASSASITTRFDDIAINDTSGSVQTSWPGPGKIYLLAPNGDNTVAWTKGGTPAATNWQGVDEVPGDIAGIDTDYNHDSGSTNEDRLDLTALGAEVTSDAVLAVLDLYARVGLGAAGSGTMALKVWNDSAAATEGPTITVTSTTARILTTAEHQVYSLAGYAKTNLDGFSAGYIAKSGAIEKRTYALWANVEWIEATAPPPGAACSSRMAMMGVGC